MPYFFATLSRSRVLTGLILITLLCASIGFATYYLPVKQMERGNWVSHTRIVLDQLQTLESHIALFNSARPIPADPRQHLELDVRRIQGLTADNPSQQAYIQTLMAQLQQNEHAQHVLETIRRMLSHEQQLLDARVERWQDTVQLVRIVLAGSVALLYALVVLVFSILRKDSIHRKKLFEAEQQTALTHRLIAERLGRVVNIQREMVHERLNIEALMQVITERAQEIAHADGAVVEMHEDDCMVYRAASGIMAQHKGMRIPFAESMSGLSIVQGKVLACADSETDRRVNRDACRKVGLRSMVVVPLSHKGESVGVLKVAYAKPKAYTDDHIATLEMMASVLSSTLNDAATTDALVTANTLLNETNSLLETQKDQLEIMATTDVLTGLKNHRYFQEKLMEEYQRSLRYKAPFSLLLLDVDHFKAFNDLYGHPAGDAALKQVGTILKTVARETDCVARYGGEEFALILPNTDKEGAIIIAERLRKAVETAVWEHRAVTVSVGISTFGEQVENAHGHVEAADQALYLSKAAGRNHVTHITDACPVKFKNVNT